MTTTITVTGNVTDQPEVGFTNSGTAAANFSIADNARYQDEQTGEWKDGNVTYWRIEVFGSMAERVADQVHKGRRVVVTGRTRTKEWRDRDGNKRVELRVRATDVALSLKYAAKGESNTADEEADS